MEKFISLHYLRGFAAVAVMLFHFRHSLPTPWLFSGGGLGVDVFFVLSGFIMHNATKRGPTAVGFLLRRGFRILPATWVTIFLQCKFLGISLLGRHALWAFAFIPLQKEGSPYFGFGIVGTLWSLGYELWFYLYYAAGLALSQRRRTWMAGGLIIAIVSAVQLARQGRIPTNPWQGAGFFPINGFPEQFLSVPTNPLMFHFLFGLVLALVIEKYQPAIDRMRPALRRSSSALAALWFVAIANFWPVSPDTSTSRIIGVPGIFLAFYLLESDLLRWKPNFLTRALGFLGDISFSVYLLHIVVLNAAQHRLGFRYESVPGFFALIAVTGLSSWLMFRFVELPSIAAGKYLARRYEGAGEIPAPSTELRKAG